MLSAILRQRRLRLLRQTGKRRRVLDRQVRLNLAVQFHPGLLQTVDELVVAQPVQLGSRANPYDPKRPVLPLPLLPSTVCELEPTLYRFFRSEERRVGE